MGFDTRSRSIEIINLSSATISESAQEMGVTADFLQPEIKSS
jgi:hypothetical protein